MASWSDFENELRLWRAAHRVPTFWWRDDDACAATPMLETLLALSEKRRVPVHLAVIPLQIQADLVERLRDCCNFHVLQHGFAHLDHEPSGLGASEFGDHRDIELQLLDLRQGWQRLVLNQLPNLLPCLVPPWNRMSSSTMAALPRLGYKFLSAFDGPTSTLAIDGLIRVDANVDPIRWRHEKKFRGKESTLELFVKHLADRREERTGYSEPTGFLTHHLDTGGDIWDFVDELFDRTAHDGIAKWINLASHFETS